MTTTTKLRLSALFFCLGALMVALHFVNSSYQDSKLAAVEKSIDRLTSRITDYESGAVDLRTDAGYRSKFRVDLAEVKKELARAESAVRSSTLWKRVTLLSTCLMFFAAAYFGFAGTSAVRSDLRR